VRTEPLIDGDDERRFRVSGYADAALNIIKTNRGIR